LNLLGGFAFLMLLAMAINTAVTKVYPQLVEWSQSSAPDEVEPPREDAK
jgi:hypothetical protein